MARLYHELQRLLCALLVVNVCAGAEPLDYLSGIVAHGKSATQMPTEATVRSSTEAILYLVALARLNRVGPTLYAALHVLGVNNILPVPALSFFQRKPCVLHPTSVVVIKIAIGSRRPDYLRHGVC